MIYERYPISKKENCSAAKKHMDGLRDAYRKRLIQQSKEKKEY
jgi:hypothetical protein